MKAVLALAALLPLPALAQEAQSVAFTCADGRVVDVAYPDAATAVLTVDDGAPVGLALVEAPEGEEAPALPTYVGEGVQWMADGLAAGMLAPLAPGEMMASEAGVACVADPAAE